jgi:hypothetical protein
MTIADFRFAGKSLAWISTIDRGFHLEPLAEVERALLVVKVLESPQPQLGSLLVLRGAEHYCQK